MGAEQSSAARGAEAPSKTCYYELLGVNHQAREDEIRKAYRTKALELHPDRNYDDVENATRQFAEVQTAYEVLSDPHERAWYDSHRDQILRGSDDDDAAPSSVTNVKYTSASHIASLIGKFNGKAPFTDGPAGFYGSLQEFFATLAREETAACAWGDLESIDYPEFGSSSADYEEVVKPFYKVWQNFSTKKNFSWKDIYAPSQAPDRAIRRLIEKENRKSRDDGIKEFNDAVRHLVAFVRKRDPRYFANTRTQADRQKVMRDAAATQAARSRAANKAKLVSQPLPAWVEAYKSEEESDPAESEEYEVEHVECVACHKIFKSERQFEAHERSKKHLKAVQHVRKQMRQDQEILDFAGTSTPLMETSLDQTVSDDPFEPDFMAQGKESTLHRPSYTNENGPVCAPLEVKSLSGTESSSDSTLPYSDHELASRADIQSQVAAETLKSLDLDGSTIEGSDPNKGTTGESTKKIGKAKEKRAKKAARQGNTTQAAQDFKCARCHNAFSSNTKLFNHIKEMNHAQPVTDPAKAKKKVKP